MLVRRGRSKVLAVVVCALVALAASGCRGIKVSDTQTISPPDPGATGFASAFSMDEGRIVVRAVVGDSPVVYVFERVGSGWSHSATLTPGPDATAFWGFSVAVSGDTIAVADPAFVLDVEGVDNSGVVDVYDLADGTWTQTETVALNQEYVAFAYEVWLGGSGLLVRSSPVCDGSCSVGGTYLFQRSGGAFQPLGDGGTGLSVSVGVDHERLLMANSSAEDPFGEYRTDNLLKVWDTASEPPALLVDEVVRYGEPGGQEPVNTGYFWRGDLSGELLAYENCCSTDSRLHILRDTGNGYEPEATFGITRQSAGISVVPGAVLVADRTTGSWHTYILGEDGWQRSVELPAPDTVAAQFAQQPIAVGNQVAVQGDGVLHVLTVDLFDVGGGSG